jgi:preprotein translocase subunit SecB
MNKQNQAEAKQQIFEIQKLYLKDVSLEAPKSPEIFTLEWKPQTNIQLSSEAKMLGDDVHEVVLTVTVTTKSGDETAYLVEIQQAGIFTTKGFTKEQLGPLLGSYCPNLMFPFAREAVAELVSKGGFPQLLLSPVNFDALYTHHQQQLEQQVAAKTKH